MKINNKGLSVVELIVSFVLCILVFVFIIQVVSAVEELYINLGIKTELLNKQSLISEEINSKFLKNKIILIKNCGENCLTFFYKDNTYQKMQIDKELNNFIFGEAIYNFNGLGFVDALTVTLNSDRTYDKGILTINLNVKNSIFDNGKYVIKALCQYDSSETVYSPLNSDKAEIFLLGPAVSYKFSEDLFIEPGWIVYYPSGKITINESDVKPSPIEFDSDGNGFIKYRGVNEASGSEKTRTIKNHVTIKDHIINLYENSSEDIYLYSGMGRYVYKGSDPDNYLAIGSKKFRIISLDVQSQYVLDENNNIVEIDGIKQKEMKYLVKVVSEDAITDENGNDMLPFGTERSGILSESVWSKKNCNDGDCVMLKQYINSVVNEIYLPSLLNTGAGKLQIRNGTFNSGVVDRKIYKFYCTDCPKEEYLAKTIYDVEGADVTWGNGATDLGKWSGNCLDEVCGPNAAIMSLTDVLFASSDAECLDTIAVERGTSCSQKNWLWKQRDTQYRLMTRNTINNTWVLTDVNYFGQQAMRNTYKTKATLFLDADLYEMGNGSEESPYVLYSIEKQN